MSLRVRVTAAAASCVLALSACGGGDTETDGTGPSDGGGNIATPTPSDGGESTGASETPAPDPADFPGMDQNSPEGAEQAFRYYVAQMKYAFESGDEEELERLGSDDCQGCNSIVGLVGRNREWGATWGCSDFEEVSMEQLNPLRHDSEIEMRYRLGAHSEPTGPGGKVEQLGRTEYIATAGLNWSDGRWLVHGVELEWGPDAHDS